MSERDLVYRLVLAHQDDGRRRIGIGIYPVTLEEWCIRLAWLRFGMKPLLLKQNDFDFEVTLYKGNVKKQNPTGYYFEKHNKARLLVEALIVEHWLKCFLSILKIGPNFLDHFDIDFHPDRREKGSKPLHLDLFMSV